MDNSSNNNSNENPAPNSENLTQETVTEISENISESPTPDSTTENKKKIKRSYLIATIVMFVLAAGLLLGALITWYKIYNEGNRVRAEGDLIAEAWLDSLDDTPDPTPTPTPTIDPNITIDPEATPTPMPTPTPTLRPMTTRLPVDLKKVIAMLYLNKQVIPIYGEWSEELLKHTVCKYYGSEPNEDGNLGLIGHAYASGDHFGALYTLKIGQKVSIMDKKKLPNGKNRVKVYEVYEILKIKYDDTEQLKTISGTTVTLITCTEGGKRRLVVKCKEIVKN